MSADDEGGPPPLTANDQGAGQPESAGSTPVSELFEDAVVWVRPEATLEEVADGLAAADIGAMVVGDGTRVAGIVSERDLVRAVAERRPLAGTRAVDIAHTNLVWCDRTATVAEVAAEMMDRYVRHVLVEDEGSLVGIVSARDLLGVYATEEEETG